MCRALEEKNCATLLLAATECASDISCALLLRAFQTSSASVFASDFLVTSSGFLSSSSIAVFMATSCFVSSSTTMFFPPRSTNKIQHSKIKRHKDTRKSFYQCD